MAHKKTLCVLLIACISYVKSQTNEGDRCIEKNSNTYGRCTPAQSCESARLNYQRIGIRPTFCTYNAFGTTLVCCTDGVSIFNAANSNPSSQSLNAQLPVPKRVEEGRISERNDETTNTTDEILSYNGTDIENRNSVAPDITESAYKIPFTEKPALNLMDRKHYNEYKDVKEHKTENKDTKNTVDEDELITMLWVIKLKKLQNAQRRYAEKIINDVLFEGEMGGLGKDHLSFLNNNDIVMKISNFIDAYQEASSGKPQASENVRYVTDSYTTTTNMKLPEIFHSNDDGVR